MNDAPVVQYFRAGTLEDTPVNIDLLSRASDLESPTLTIDIVSGPQHGSLTRNPDGNYTYTPDPNYNGFDRFSYQANDGYLNSSSAEVRLTVGAVNDAPVVQAIDTSTHQDTPVSIDLLSTTHDPDSPKLTASIASHPAHGSLSRNADGSYTYTPDVHYNGSDQFSYQVSDGKLSSNLVSVSLNITPAEDTQANQVDPKAELNADPAQASAPPTDASSLVATDDRSARLIISSSDSNAPLINIDWAGQPDPSFMTLPLPNTSALPGRPPEKRSLAELTGLVVSVPS